MSRRVRSFGLWAAIAFEVALLFVLFTLPHHPHA
jgi:hypothetical protein